MNPLYAMLDDGHEFHEDYIMPSKEYIDILLKSNLEYFTNVNTTSIGQIRSNGTIVDSETEYYLNNFGYRDADWNDKAEILAIGCSNTYGYGVSVDGRWTNLLAKSINKNIRNLSFPGAPITDLINKSFQYFKMFGNPEIMLCLLPDPFRIKLPFKKNLNKGTFINNKTFDRDLFVGDVYFNHEPEKILSRMQYFKMPYDYGQILPLELPLLFSMQSIHILEQYCKSNNIKLIWSSWHRPTVEVLNNSEEKIFDTFFANKDVFIDHNYEDGLEIFNTNCHEEYRDMYSKYFDMGCDIEDGVNFAHPGVHKHLHIAEAFYKEINK